VNLGERTQLAWGRRVPGGLLARRWRSEGSRVARWRGWRSVIWSHPVKISLPNLRLAGGQAGFPGWVLEVIENTASRSWRMDVTGVFARLAENGVIRVSNGGGRSYPLGMNAS